MVEFADKNSFGKNNSLSDLIIPTKIISGIIGRGIPKPEDNQNTDDMVYGGDLNRITFKDYGKDFFANERKNNPSHPLNNPNYNGANILIGGENYGTGSSREHAPQAHLSYGINGLIAAGYAGIFQENCAAIGLVAVTVSRDYISTLAKLVESFPDKLLYIDLLKKLIYYKDTSLRCIPFEISESVRQNFLTGTWDAFSLLRSNPEMVDQKMKEIPYFSFK